MKAFLLKMIGDDPSVSSGRVAGMLLVLVGAGLCILAAVAKNTFAVAPAAACLTAGLGALGVKGYENVKKTAASVMPKTVTATDPPKKTDPPPTPAPAKD